MAVDELKRELQAVGNYDLVEKIAEGGMGTVYKGRNRLTGDVVAVKVVPPHIAANPVYLKRFEKEYNAAKALDHPNIVRALDFGWHGESPYLVMEFVEGESLGQRLERDHLLSEAEALSIIEQVAQGIDSAHAMGLVHRDVKPDNILLTSDGTAKLIDLGLVKDADVDLNLTRTGRGLGTPHFMAPEQFRNAKHADARCDIYSLAATMYMMVTGELPFQSTGPLDAWMKKVRSDILPPGQLATDLSARADWAIRRAMSVDPASRPASCREFVDNLKTESEFTPTPVGSDFDTAVTSLWHVLYQDAKGVMHMTQESSEGIRRVLIDGSLGPAEKIRLALSLQGPFEPAENFEQFRDAVHVPVAALAGEEDDRITMEMPALKAGEDGQSETHRPALAGPLIDLGLRRPSYDWLAWLTLFVLGAAAALIGYQLLPGLRWRWF